ncbi:hypothetical protein PssvBMR6_gp03 [Pseudomonas phage MR6]|uniref:Uncharacterized protein n=1 Tax=Pseudomonas phage MR5 TaxID=2711172 RepID=A0A6M3TCM9_9CAUD|nr:hypothetical protein PssvBMR5_gp03 [Pseudomonas phage MR5]QJD54831.1 hypothetical protein PssvBMR6_gp03 [Pseudomonas phage MR6]QJD54890.1 hypothetical protein PssvBMR7_gp03 [Pseudomonas phage MR7]QJD54951.1 hypothetical protein PssvBMR8_gp03 [Pseudomonas phage MR8]QJD55008.1 hypothetical protein PssvBMR12_gp03 [Pseudomonas phage MR12]QJF74572.1 hypothetical protein PssvBMR16_gp03 [Pseudomonas phage MR16]
MATLTYQLRRKLREKYTQGLITAEEWRGGMSDVGNLECLLSREAQSKPSERAVSKAKAFALPYSGHKATILAVDEASGVDRTVGPMFWHSGWQQPASSAFADAPAFESAPQDIVDADKPRGMSAMEASWAIAHDWWVLNTRLAANTYSVTVTDFSTDEAGTHHAVDKVFTDFEALRAWAGY